MLVAVTYDNPHYEEHNEYTVTLAEVLDCLGEIVKSEWVVGELEKSGEAVIKNGYATTTITSTVVCAICGEERPVLMVRWGDHVGRLPLEQMDEQIPACKDCSTGKENTLNQWNPGDQANPAVMCEFCQTIDTPIGGNYIMTVSEEECKWFDRENHKTNNSAGRINNE